jgi:hypothetical protein
MAGKSTFLGLIKIKKPGGVGVGRAEADSGVRLVHPIADASPAAVCPDRQCDRQALSRTTRTNTATILTQIGRRPAKSKGTTKSAADRANEEPSASASDHLKTNQPTIVPSHRT